MIYLLKGQSAFHYTISGQILSAQPLYSIENTELHPPIETEELNSTPHRFFRGDLLRIE